MNQNIYCVFQQAWHGREQEPFLLLEDGQSLSFADIDDLSARFVTLLQREGLQPGDRVMVQVGKSPAAVALYLAALRSGAIYVPLNTAYTAAEVCYFIGNAEPRVFVSQPDSTLQSADLGLVSDQCTHWQLGTRDDDPLLAKVQECTPTVEIAGRSLDDLASFLYTSGTTGRSKGAMLSHGNLLSNARSLVSLWRFDSTDVLLHALPIFHIHGLFVALHCALLSACRVQFLNAYQPASVRKALAQGTTVMMGVPTFYTRLLDQADFSASECSSVRVFISGSAPMTEAVHAAWTERTGHRILERYGMTEAGMITSNPYEGERVPGTVGFALPYVELRVADESGVALPAGQAGSVEIRGPNLFKGYWQMPDKTAEDMRDDGFFITGDLGVLDEEGRLSVIGRSKDLIISGGYNIYPKEIEVLIDEMPGVAESAVIGVPHADMGEAVVAVLVGSDPPSEPQVIEQLSLSLARFKLPRRVVVLDELPRNSMGKVQKNLLRNRFGGLFESGS